MSRNTSLSQYEAAVRKRRILATVLIFVGIPLIIAIGTVLLENKNDILISFLVLFMTMLPFFLVFEKRKPKARELVLIAMMTALTVLFNLISIGIQLHIGTALVIIAGISLGPEAGFLIGALARLLCNFFQGQGPWTPWEMFCWGLLGFLAGVVFHKVDIQKMRSRNFQIIMGPVLCITAAWVVSYIVWLLKHSPNESFFGWRLYAYGAAGLLFGVLLQRKRMPVDDLTVTLFTFFTVFIIYGGIMNFAAMVTTGMIHKNTESLKLLYLSGVPYDFMHAAGAALCSFLFGEKMIRKLERIKIKFGIYR